MKKLAQIPILVSTALLLLFGEIGTSQSIPEDSLYLGQTPPGNTPKLFQLPVTSGLFVAERIAISPDGKEIYYTELNNYPATIQRINYFVYSGNVWNGPFVLFDGYNSPGLSPGGDTMFFQKNETEIDGTYRTYFTVRNDTGWSTPSKFLSTPFYTHYFQETNTGSYYVSSNASGSLGGFDWCGVNINNNDTTLQSLGLPLNTTGDNLDFFVARDESFIIAATGSAFKISFHKTDGGWTNPKNLGITYNHPWNWGPFITADNKYMFHTSGSSTATTRIYWVRVDNLIDSLRHSNFVPYVKAYIPDQTDTVGQIFSYTLLDSVFIDDDGNHTLTYSATLSNGSPLPSWLSFDSLSRTFSGTPTATGYINIKVKTTDTAMVSVSDIFKLTIVAQPVKIDEDRGSLPNKLQLFPNYPNPFNPSTTIVFSLPENQFVTLKIYNSTGQLVTKLIEQSMNAGRHQLQWNAAGQASGVYMYCLQTGNNKISRKLLLLK